MAGALYRMDYSSKTSASGVVYVGDDGIVGMDAAGGNIIGELIYTDRARGSVYITYSSDGTLVTGQTLVAGAEVKIDLDLDLNFTSGQQVSGQIDGVPISIKFTKISDIPIPLSMDFRFARNSGLNPLIGI